MRLALRLLGCEVLAVELGAEQQDHDAELAPPFGFSGSGMGQAERAEEWASAEETRGRRCRDGSWA